MAAALEGHVHVTVSHQIARLGSGRDRIGDGIRVNRGRTRVARCVPTILPAVFWSPCALRLLSLSYRHHARPLASASPRAPSCAHMVVQRHLLRRHPPRGRRSRLLPASVRGSLADLALHGRSVAGRLDGVRLLSLALAGLLPTCGIHVAVSLLVTTDCTRTAPSGQHGLSGCPSRSWGQAHSRDLSRCACCS